MNRRLRRGLALAALGAALLGCRSPLPPLPVPSAAPLAAAPVAADRAPPPGEAGVYTIDAAASRLRIYAFRGGQAARLGHNHVLSAPALEGYVQLPGDEAREARFDLRLRLDTLVIDDPAAREQTGGGFAGARSEADIAGTRRNLLGPRGLDAAAYPELRVRSLAIEGDWPLLVARVAIELHGVTREQEVLLDVEREPQRLRARGAFVVRQSDFGIAPLSILGGLVAVQDAVAVRFDLVARTAAR